MADKVEFKASLPPIAGAIQLDGHGDGGQLKLDVPRKYVVSLMALQTMAGHTLKVTIEDEGEGDITEWQD